MSPRSSSLWATMTEPSALAFLPTRTVKHSPSWLEAVGTSRARKRSDETRAMSGFFAVFMAPMYTSGPVAFKPDQDPGRSFQDEPAASEVHVDAIGPEDRMAQEAGQIPAADRVQLLHREFVRGLTLEDERTEGDRQTVDRG